MLFPQVNLLPLFDPFAYNPFAQVTTNAGVVVDDVHVECNDILNNVRTSAHVLLMSLLSLPNSLVPSMVLLLLSHKIPSFNPQVLNSDIDFF